MKRYDQKPEYSEDPEEILEGDEIEGRYSFCKNCFGQIYAPILNLIWYHRDTRFDDCKNAEPADTLTQLFLQYENDGKGTLIKISRYDDKETLACPCYLKWYNLLKKDVEEGFHGEHYFDKTGMTLCKMYLIRLSNEPITDPSYPEKQGYNCEECIEILRKKKVLEIIPPKGKNKNVIFNRIKWLKK